MAYNEETRRFLQDVTDTELHVEWLTWRKHAARAV